MFAQIRSFLEMIRFSHTLFAMPFALLAAVMAWTVPGPNGATVSFSWLHLLGIVLCMAFARSAAMAFNRIADRHIDAENERTAKRHIPAGILSLPMVILFTAVSSIGFVLSTLLFLPNPLPIALSVPVLLVLCFYSYTKRFTSLAHFWLGLSLMLAPISAWIALRGEILLDHPGDLIPASVLGLAVLLWVAGFDIIYACQDFEFDRGAKLRSIPVALGIKGALRLSAACHYLMIAALACLPWLTPGLGLVFVIGVVLVAGLLVVEHWLVSPDDLTRVNIAFFHVNSIVSMGLFIVGSIDLLVA